MKNCESKDNRMEIKMELHGDVLGVVRTFALPRMRFVNEFAEARRLLRENNIGYSHSLLEGVKAKLSTGEAEQVFEVFRVYIEATLALHEAGKHLATNKNAFTVAMLHHEEMEDMLITAVRGPQVMD
jgi:hypothetical protein